MPSYAQTAAQVRVTPVPSQVTTSALTNVTVQVIGATGLYAIDIIVKFDPVLLEAAGTSPGQQYVPVTPGTFLEAGTTTANQADNSAGTIHFAMTQIGASPAKSGDGLLFSINLRGRANIGLSALTFTKVQLTSQNGTLLPTTLTYGEITVIAGPPGSVAQTPLPTITPWPTLNPGGSPIDTPTPGAPQLPTQTATASPTPTATASPVAESTVIPSPLPPVLPSVTHTALVPTHTSTAIATASTSTPTPVLTSSTTPTTTAVIITVTQQAPLPSPDQALTSSMQSDGGTEPSGIATSPSLSGTNSISPSLVALSAPPSRITQGQARAPLSADEKRAQLTRATIETLILLALCLIGLIVMAAGVVVVRIMLQPPTGVDGSQGTRDGG